MFIELLPTSNSPRQIDNPKCSILTKDTVGLDMILLKYFKDSFLDNVICEICSSSVSESIKPTFTVLRYLEKPPSVLKIILQRGTYDMTNGEAQK